MDTSSIQKIVIDRRTKGFPGTAEATLLADIGNQGWNVLREDMPLPLMVLKRSNLNHNSDVFAQYLESYDLSLAPHGKTTMSPQIFEEQIQKGAWGITAATIDQMQVMRHYGVDRVILANQLVGKSNIKTVIAELNADPEFEFFCFIDSVEQLQNIEGNLEVLNQTRPINVLVEIGAIGGRTGVRNKGTALSLIENIIERPQKLKFCGIGAFEGAIPGLDRGSQPVTKFAELILDIIRDIPQTAYSGLSEFILTGGGSAYFDMIAKQFKSLQLSVPVRVLLRTIKAPILRPKNRHASIRTATGTTNYGQLLKSGRMCSQYQSQSWLF
jgi:D-serine dehydratase